MNPTASDVHVNAPLTMISIAFLQNQDAFIADKVFPNIPVEKQADRFFTYDRGDFNRDEARVRAPGTESAGGDYRIDNTPTYYANVWAWHKDIPDQIRANADAPLNLDMEATEFVTTKLLIRKEAKFVSSFMTTNVWTTDKTGAASPTTGQLYQWSDYTNSDPLTDVRAGMTVVHKSTGFRPNKLVLGQEVWDKLVDHPDIIDRVKYGQTAGKPAMVSKEAVAQILELEEILVGSAIYNSAAETVTNSHAFITGKTALLVYSAPRPGLMTPSGGYTFSWKGMFGANANGLRISKFRDEKTKSDRVEGEMAFDQKLISANLGYFFTSIVA